MGGALGAELVFVKVVSKAPGVLALANEAVYSMRL